MIREQEIKSIAEICHEINKAYCYSQGDHTQTPWSEAPDWQKDSAIKGVQFHLENPHAGPAGSHNSWLEEKIKDGWVWGEVKDAQLKTHPCIKPYDELDKAQQAKDYIFCELVHKLVPVFDKPALDSPEAPTSPTPA